MSVYERALQVKARLSLEFKDMVKTPAGMRRYGLPMFGHIPGTPWLDEENTPGRMVNNQRKKPAATRKPAADDAPKPRRRKAPESAVAKRAAKAAEAPKRRRKTSEPAEPVKKAVAQKPPAKKAPAKATTGPKKTGPAKTAPRKAPRAFKPRSHQDLVSWFEGDVDKVWADPEKAKAIRQYKGAEYLMMNALQRRDRPPGKNKRERALREKWGRANDMLAASMSPLPEPMRTYRVMAMDNLPPFRAGDRFQDNGFVSTTVNPERLPEIQAELYGDADEHAYMEIRTPAGTPALYMEAYANKFRGIGADEEDQPDLPPGEEELLLNRQMNYKVISDTVEEVDGIRERRLIVEVEQ